MVTAGEHTVNAPLVFLGVNALAPPQYVDGLAPGMRAERGQVLVTGALAVATLQWRVRNGDGVVARAAPSRTGAFVCCSVAGDGDEPDSLFHQFTAGSQTVLESEGSARRSTIKNGSMQFALLFRNTQACASPTAGAGCNRSPPTAFAGGTVRCQCATSTAPPASAVAAIAHTMSPAAHVVTMATGRVTALNPRFPPDQRVDGGRRPEQPLGQLDRRTHAA